MKTIYKYPLEPGENVIEIPARATLLSVQVQGDSGILGDSVQLWALVDPDRRTERRQIVVVGTGHSIPEGVELAFIDTFQLHGGKLVFHAFEVL